MEDLLGEQIVVIEGEENAGHRGHRGADRHRQHLPAEAVDTERLRGFFVFADRLPVVPWSRLEKKKAQSESAGGQRQHAVLEAFHLAFVGAHQQVHDLGERSPQER